MGRISSTYGMCPCCKGLKERMTTFNGRRGKSELCKNCREYKHKLINQIIQMLERLELRAKRTRVGSINGWFIDYRDLEKVKEELNKMDKSIK